MAEAQRKAFIIGHPVAHSRSPLIHGYWLKQHGIAGSYERIDVPPGEVADFVRALPESGFVGGNVTLPHKQAVCALADELDDATRQIGAANTLWIENGRVHAGNTDTLGFASNLDLAAPAWRSAGTALVLGAGGAARAILFALKQAGIAKIHLVNRSRERAEELAALFGPGIAAGDWDERDALGEKASLVVHTTSVGMDGQGGSPLDVGRLAPDTIVADIVYTPLATPLLAAATRRGLTTVDGLGMLLHQAVPGFERWFGVRPTVTDELRAIIVDDIEAAA